MSNYVSGLENANQLLDMISEGREQRDNRGGKVELLYPEVGLSMP